MLPLERLTIKWASHLRHPHHLLTLIVCNNPKCVKRDLSSRNTETQRDSHPCSLLLPARKGASAGLACDSLLREAESGHKNQGFALLCLFKNMKLYYTCSLSWECPSINMVTWNIDRNGNKTISEPCCSEKFVLSNYYSIWNTSTDTSTWNTRH